MKTGACVLSACMSNRPTVITNKSRMSVAEPNRGSGQTHLTLQCGCLVRFGCDSETPDPSAVWPHHPGRGREGRVCQHSVSGPLYQSFSALALLTFGLMALCSGGLPCAWGIFSNIPGPYPVVSVPQLPVPAPSCNHRKWLQTLSDVRWGGS